MNTALEQLDLTRQRASQNIPQGTKSELGQYMTPSRIADFMASLFSTDKVTDIRLLDAGTGIGSLSIAFFERLLAESKVKSVAWVGYEIDKNLSAYLSEHIRGYMSEFLSNGVEFISELRTIDFVEDAVKRILFDREAKFNFAILNPPYKKINSHSRQRLLLRELKIETVNLYTCSRLLAGKADVRVAGCAESKVVHAIACDVRGHIHAGPGIGTKGTGCCSWAKGLHWWRVAVINPIFGPSVIEHTKHLISRTRRAVGVDEQSGTGDAAG